ncbi:MAG: multidrug transporter [Chitinophagaceae bacterium]|nr:MAG: multidrug transporter [Chitinophagaceae bacterium]
MPSLLGLIGLFDLNGEGGFPALFSTALLLTSASLLWLIYTMDKKKTGKAHPWKTLCFVFIFLGLDELLVIHEKFDRFQTVLNNYLQLPAGYLYWVATYAVLLTAFAVYFLRFYLQLPKDSRLRFTVAGIVYVGAALGMEIITAFLTKNLQLGPYPVSLLEALEEVMEMIGVILFIRALLLHIRNQPTYPVLNVNLQYRSNGEKEETYLKEAEVRTAILPESTGKKLNK